MGRRINVVFVFVGMLRYKGRMLKQIGTLRQAGHDVTVLHGRTDDEEADDSTYDFKILDRPLRRHPNKVRNYLNHLRWNLRAAEELVQLEPDAIVCEELYGALSGALARRRLRATRYIFDCNELFMHMGMRPLKKLMWRPVHAVVFRAADVILHAERNRLEFCRTHYRSRAQHVLIENLPRPSRPVPERSRETTAPLDIVYIGALQPERCCEEVIDAFAEVDPAEARCDFIGFGPEDYQRMLHERIAAHGIDHVRILPPVSHAEMYECLSGYDAGLAFYRNDNLNQYYCAPNKIYDYFLCGLPAITNNFPGLHQVVEDQHVGICLDSITGDAMRGALKRIWKDAPAENITPGFQARYSWSAQEKRYRKIFESASSQEVQED
ncbi:glycosyltransferase family 4 protein [Kiritimatiella glycovorans]|uniref:Glycosyl transferases group 1 n=1 Tax=Kiritimatiella glycovorans TaxID=1307763 RepID=A0A0G3EN06_9BACT|nr:glycosyltransferase family 4 protein [Kiritimatiella glycovorans]AKJ65519.1 Glycosyl transferases group 1 [Kiritimatiella glycovorans]